MQADSTTLTLVALLWFIVSCCWCGFCSLAFMFGRRSKPWRAGIYLPACYIFGFFAWLSWGTFLLSWFNLITVAMFAGLFVAQVLLPDSRLYPEPRQPWGNVQGEWS